MAEITGKYFSQGSELKDTARFDPNILDTGVIVYEVVRVINGIVLFLEDHFSRLQESVSLSSYSFHLTLSELHHILSELIKSNDRATGNIKIIVHFNIHQSPVLYAFFIPHAYPVAAMYQNGVESDFFRAERIDPNIKKLHPALIERVVTFIKTQNLYDALLVSEDETVTEGSKTNIFFIRGDSLFTAPGSMVLKGITRQKVIQLSKDLHIPIIEETLNMHDLETFEAAFFSGTSPKILPVSRIAHIHFNPHHSVLRQIMLAYDELITAYIHKKNRML